MFKRFRNKGRGRNQRFICEGKQDEQPCCAHSLSDFAQGAELTVVSNSDRKTLEMGLYAGASVKVVKNRPRDANMLIATGESRYIIAKDSAQKIIVR